MLGDKIDVMVQQYIQDKMSLAEFGGPATLTPAWSKSLLRHMDFTQR